MFLATKDLLPSEEKERSLCPLNKAREVEDSMGWDA